jgi:hypothetical protein
MTSAPASAQKTLKHWITSSDELCAVALELLGQRWDRRTPVRLVGVGVANVVSGDAPVQQELFPDGNDRKRKVEEAVSRLREKIERPAPDPRQPASGTAQPGSASPDPAGGPGAPVPPTRRRASARQPPHSLSSLRASSRSWFGVQVPGHQGLEMIAVLDAGRFRYLLYPLALQSDQVGPQNGVVVEGGQLRRGVLDQQLDELVHVDPRLLHHLARDSCHDVWPPGKQVGSVNTSRSVTN